MNSNQNTPKDSQEPHIPNIVWFYVLFGLIAAIWLINFLGAQPFAQSAGELGDMFGITNALFSGGALAGVVYAIFAQRAELNIAKDELSRTKQILSDQQKSLKLQNEETQKQIFENTFFQLVRLHVDILRSIDVNDVDGHHQGADAFRAFQNELPRIQRNLNNKRTMGSGEVGSKEIYLTLYNRAQNDLGHYFRSLYNILKFVDTSNVENKKLYTNIIRNILSNSELELLIYNGASRHGKKKMLPLLERYEFFDNLPLNSVAYKDVLTEYERRAFGQNEEILNHLITSP